MENSNKVSIDIETDDKGNIVYTKSNEKECWSKFDNDGNCIWQKYSFGNEFHSKYIDELLISRIPQWRNDCRLFL